MIDTASRPSATISELRRVLVLADESAGWKIAGLRQLDRIAFTLAEYAQSIGEQVTLCVAWASSVPAADRWLPSGRRTNGLTIESSSDPFTDTESFDLTLTTRVFLYRNSVPDLLETLGTITSVDEPIDVLLARQANAGSTNVPWAYVHSEAEIGACERAFLRNSGKSQDGLASRYVNRPISRTVSRFLLKLPITPSAWSVLIFALPLCASALLLRGTNRAFLIACAIFQLYSILDGCDGEIARAKFLQSESGRRLDSLLDLLGNMLLALCLGLGLAHQWERAHASGWFYVAEGVAAAAFIILSEGIVFVRRSRSDSTPVSAKWNGALYQRHHEFLERSGILFLGENVAWWLVQLTKRDMAMLAFVLLAALGWAEAILHLLLLVSGVSSALAGNAFLRQPAPALPQEAS